MSADVLPNIREQEKARLIAIVSDPLESELARACAGEELFALGRLVEVDYQREQWRALCASATHHGRPVEGLTLHTEGREVVGISLLTKQAG